MENFFLKNSKGENNGPVSDRAAVSGENNRPGIDIFDGRFADYKSVLAELDEELEARIDYSRKGAFTRPQRDAIGRVAEKITSSGTGSFADEAVLSSAVELSRSVKALLSLSSEAEPRETADLAGELESVLHSFGDGKSAGEMADINKEKFIGAVALLAEAGSCLEKSYYQENDQTFPVNGEYPRLDVLLAQGKVVLRRIAKANQDFVPEGKNFDEFLECLQGIVELRSAGEDSDARKNKSLLKKMGRKPAVLRKLTNGISMTA